MPDTGWVQLFTLEQMELSIIGRIMLALLTRTLADGQYSHS